MTDNGLDAPVGAVARDVNALKAWRLMLGMEIPGTPKDDEQTNKDTKQNGDQKPPTPQKGSKSAPRQGKPPAASKQGTRPSAPPKPQKSSKPGQEGEPEPQDGDNADEAEANESNDGNDTGNGEGARSTEGDGDSGEGEDGNPSGGRPGDRPAEAQDGEGAVEGAEQDGESSSGTGANPKRKVSQKEVDRLEKALDHLHKGEQEGNGQSDGKGGKPGGKPGKGHSMSTPEWLKEIGELFPKNVKPQLEKQLIEKIGLKKALENKELMQNIEPDMELTKLLLNNKSLLNNDTKEVARKIIEKTVEEVTRKLKTQIEQTMAGAIRRTKHSPRKIWRNLDLKRTIRKNMQNWDGPSGRLMVDKVHYFQADKKNVATHIVICVDQSGSMVDSLVYSAIIAAIFAGIKTFKTSLVLFDTKVVDVSAMASKPVDLLMSTHLGGGTDIAAGIELSTKLMTDKAKTLFVLVSDMEDVTNDMRAQYGGAYSKAGNKKDFVQLIGDLTSQGVRCLGIGALDYGGTTGRFDARNAALLQKVGCPVMSCQPEDLPKLIDAVLSKRKVT